MPTSTEILASYVPSLILRAIEKNPAPRREPSAATFPAAVLFADITGFTALTERLGQRGPAGAEEMTSILNAYFEPLVALVNAHGGDIVKFAGDALLAVFPAEDEPATDGAADGRLAAVAARAAHCGVMIQSTLGSYQAAPGISLQVRVGIGAGDVVTSQVGGVAGRWELLVAGAPLAQVGQAESLADPGQVILSKEAWALVAPKADGQPVAGGYARLDRVREPLPIRALRTPVLGPAAEPALHAYIPANVAVRLDAGQTQWLAELRRVTVLFINLPDLTEGASLEQAQKGMLAVQSILERYEGTITRLGADDKGTLVLAAFGLPMLAHEDDPYRAAQAALDIQAALSQEGMRGAIGVTTGRAYCGVVGSSVRHEYTMIGDAVNVAARLMQAAGAAREGLSTPIYCDEATLSEASTRLRFSAPKSIALKGKTEPVTVVEPLGPRAAVNGSQKARATLVGRVRERQLLKEALVALKTQTKGGVVLIAGEAGIGKSRLIADLVGQADEMGVSHFSATADAIEKSTAYHAWRPVFHDLLGLAALPDDRAAQRAHVLSQIQKRDPELVRLAPLLNAVLSLEIPDNEITAQITGRVRADNTRDLLVRLLEMDKPSSAPGTLLILEDAHWLDSASWALALAVSRRIPSILLVLATRPMSEPLPAEYQQLRDAAGTVRMELSRMTPDESIALVEQRLGVTALPEQAIQLIQDKAQGNPFFSEELAYALRDSGLLIVEGGQCRLAPAAGDLSSLHFPDTIQGVVTSRIDRLSPAEQLTLKVASVIGRIFGYKALQEIHPVEADKMSLGSYLTELEQLEFTPQESGEPELSYIFKHVITQEVAYNLMAFAQRRQLHQGVAEWYERTSAEDLSPYYPFLAHHWEKVLESGQKDDQALQKAIAYKEKAGDQALERFANQEAIKFFNEALELKKKAKQGGLVMFSDEAGDAVVEASFVRRKGTAHLGLSQFGPAVEALENGLTALGVHRGAQRAGLVTFSDPEPGSILSSELEDALIKQDSERLFTLLWPDPAIRERLLSDEDFATETLLTYEQLPELYYFTKGFNAMLEPALRTISLAERRTSGDVESIQPMLARAYTRMTFPLSGIPRFSGVAELYFDRAMKATKEANQLAVTAQTCFMTGIYSIYTPHLGRTLQLFESAVEAARQIGDIRREVYSKGCTAAVLYHQSRFAESERIAADAAAGARRMQDIPMQVGALIVQSCVRLVQGGEGMISDTSRLLASAESLFGPFVPPEMKLSIYGTQALLHWRSGDPALALQAIQKQSIIDLQLKSVNSMLGYLDLIEAALSLFEAECASGQAPGGGSAEGVARDACDALNMNAEQVPLLKPHALRHEGLYQHLKGASDKAHALWKESIKAAETIGLPHTEALAHYEISRHLPPEDPARQIHLNRAVEIFSATGAGHHLRLTQALQAQKPPPPTS
jgi:class 3 adenylate cyclase